ncbi:MAG: rhodanese-like domain-containing protein [Gemmatimonadota bacterium]|nr:rhodanese-like domain-containing protein [Gemmatimonadota bacterium]
MAENVMPEEAARLMNEENYVYIDVRSIAEFETGHPGQAVNIPLLHADMNTGQMVLNDDFMEVVQIHYKTDSKLVMGCRSGQRSAHAAMMLEQNGYETVVNMAYGFAGDQMGNPGWQALGLPSSVENGEGVSYESLSRK